MAVKFKCTVPPDIPMDQMAARLERGLLRVEAAAKQNLTNDASTSTGQLRMSIETNVRRRPHKIIGEVGTRSSYALYVEYGTGIYASPLGPGSHAKKIPWVYPAKRLSKFTKYVNKIRKKAGMALIDTDFYTTWGEKPKLFMHRAWNAEKARIEADLGRAFE